MLFHGLRQFNFIFFFPAWCVFRNAKSTALEVPIVRRKPAKLCRVRPDRHWPHLYSLSGWLNQKKSYTCKAWPLKHGVPMLIRLIIYNIHQYSSNDACYVILWTWRHAVWNNVWDKELKFWNRVLSTVRQFSDVCGLVSLKDQHCCLMLLLLCVVHNSLRLTGAFACKWPVGITTARYWTSETLMQYAMY